MSWSVQSQPGTAHELQEALPDIQPGQEVSEEAEEQIRVAKELAEKALFSGAVGFGEEREYVVSLSGHANPNHEPADGFANDHLTISITQQR